MIVERGRKWLLLHLRGTGTILALLRGHDSVDCDVLLPNESYSLGVGCFSELARRRFSLQSGCF